jgi:hypothetical protein
MAKRHSRGKLSQNCNGTRIPQISRLATSDELTTNENFAVIGDTGLPPHQGATRAENDGVQQI